MIQRLLLSALLLMSSFCTVQPAQATVTSTTNQIIYAGDGTSTIFSFPFNVFNSASENDLVVSTQVVSTGVITTLAINTGYTVALTHSTPSPGSITLLAGALPVGTNLSILRQLPLTQQVKISDNSATPAATTNAVYDRAIMISQQLQSQLSRAILQSVFSSSSITFPGAVAGQCIGWAGDSSLTNLDCSGSGGGGGGGGGSAFNPPIADSQLQAITSSNKVNGSAFFSLPSIPVGAGNIPAANLNVGTGANQLVQLTAASKYPAVDGSLITNISGSNFINLSSIPIGAGIIPAANLASNSHGIQVFTASGTFLAPSGVTKIYVSETGGGGGGGASDTGGSGGGGGGGASLLNHPYTVVPGNSYTVTVGAKGLGVFGSNGTNGGQSSFDTVLIANGGSGGVRNNGAGGAGGTATAANSLIGSASGAGGAGGGVPPVISTSAGGAGGAGGAGNVAAGGGGGSLFGTGGAGGNVGAGSSPSPNTGAGGGGHGGNTLADAGADGALGICVITY